MTRKAATTHLRATRRESKADIPTREVILDTAERLFAARGVDGVALRDLAREMNLTAPSLYNHFPSKQALYDAVLERGLRPIVQLVSEAWDPGWLRPDHMRVTVDGLIAHLATHPHLAGLLQRALLGDNDNAQALIARWLSPLYRQGVAVIRAVSDEAGWEPAEIPHLALGLFGMMFAYFTNVAAMRGLVAWNGDPMSAKALATQRRFLEKAIYRLLGPHPQMETRRRRTASARQASERRSDG